MLLLQSIVAPPAIINLKTWTLIHAGRACHTPNFLNKTSLSDLSFGAFQLAPKFWSCFQRHSFIMASLSTSTSITGSSGEVVAKQGPQFPRLVEFFLVVGTSNPALIPGTPPARLLFIVLKLTTCSTQTMECAGRWLTFSPNLLMRRPFYSGTYPWYLLSLLSLWALPLLSLGMAEETQDPFWFLFLVVVLQFCFPDGLSMKRGEGGRAPETRFFMFALTDAFGARLYASCLIFYEMHALQPLPESREISTGQQGRRRKRPKFAYVPKCLCIVSKRAHVDTFKRYLATYYSFQSTCFLYLLFLLIQTAFSIYSMCKDKGLELPLECYLANLLLETPASPPGTL